jgi:hypothetical protein
VNACNIKIHEIPPNGTRVDTDEQTDTEKQIGALHDNEKAATNNIQVFHMCTGLTMNSVLEGFVRKGVS